jgi:hypothetical protein
LKLCAVTSELVNGAPPSPPTRIASPRASVTHTHTHTHTCTLEREDRKILMAYSSGSPPLIITTNEESNTENLSRLSQFNYLLPRFMEHDNKIQ